MSDYIDRRAAMDLFLVDPIEDDKTTFTKGCENYILYWVQNKLAELPVIYDAVSVIRCKDCKWYVEDREFPPFCDNPICGMQHPNDETFCSYGERREYNEAD